MKKLSVFLILCSALIAAPAWSQQESEAEEFYKKGADAYFSGDYTDAIINFKRAHEISPNPMFLYNLSLAFGKLNNYAEAEDHARRALANGLPDAIQHKAGARFAAFHVLLMTEQVVEEINNPQGCASDDECGNGAACNIDTGQCELEAPEPPVAREESSTIGPLGWTGVALLATGAGLGVGAFVIDAQVAALKDDYENAAPSADRDQIRQDHDDKQQLGQILMFSAIGTGVIGGTLLVIDLLGSDDSDGTVWVPMIGPDTMGASYIGRF